MTSDYKRCRSSMYFKSFRIPRTKLHKTHITIDGVQRELRSSIQMSTFDVFPRRGFYPYTQWVQLAPSEK